MKKTGVPLNEHKLACALTHPHWDIGIGKILPSQNATYYIKIYIYYIFVNRNMRLMRLRDTLQEEEECNVIEH